MENEAIEANKKKVGFCTEFLTALMYQMWFPLILYFWIVPWLFPMYDPKKPIPAPATWSSFFLKLCLGFGCLVVFTICLVLYKQESMLYVPKQPFQTPEENASSYNSPDQRGILFEDVWTTTSDGVKLHGWHMSSDWNYPRDTILFLHENYGNLGMRLDFFELVVKKVQCNVICFSYRGFSKSEGFPSEQGICIDALAMAEFIKKCPKINKDRVFVIGRSLGSAVAINLLSKEHGLFKGAVLENTFTTLAEMAENFFVLFKMLPGLRNALTAKWNNLQLMQQLSVPVLFVFGDEDSFVSNEMAQRVYDSYFQKRRERFVVKKGNHNNTWQMGGDTYVQRLRQFIATNRKDTKKHQ